MAHKALRARACQSTPGHNVHLSAEKCEQSFSQYREYVLSITRPPAVVGFLYQDYGYKLVATQILHDAGLASNPRYKDIN